MIAGIHDFVVEQGITFSRLVQWKDSAGDPVDLTSYTAEMKIRESFDVGTVLATPSISIDAGTGTLTITMTSTVTAALDFDRAVYDIELTLAGVVTRLLQGHVTLEKESTK